MSYDVQMFVVCDHIIKTGGFPNPSITPTLSKIADENSSLQIGTYYVAYSWSNQNGETMTSDAVKIYLDETKYSINIVFDLFNSSNNDDNIDFTGNIYVGYTSEDLSSNSLTDDQTTAEKLVIQQMTRQGSSVDGTFLFDGPIADGKQKPTGNSTFYKSYVSDSGKCPRCYGKLFYFDIFFNAAGQAVTADNSIKLLQELLKIILEDKNSNVFHPDWGCDINKRIGTKKKGVADKFKIELSVRNAVQYLKNIQESNQQTKRNMTMEEMIDDIESITIEENDSTGYNVSVKVLSKAGEIIAYNVNV